MARATGDTWVLEVLEPPFRPVQRQDETTAEWQPSEIEADRRLLQERNQPCFREHGNALELRDLDVDAGYRLMLEACGEIANDHPAAGAREVVDDERSAGREPWELSA